MRTGQCGNGVKTDRVGEIIESVGGDYSQVDEFSHAAGECGYERERVGGGCGRKEVDGGGGLGKGLCQVLGEIARGQVDVLDWTARDKRISGKRGAGELGETGQCGRGKTERLCERVNVELDQAGCPAQKVDEVVVEVEGGGEAAQTGEDGGAQDAAGGVVEGDVELGELGHVCEGACEDAVEGGEEGGAVGDADCKGADMAGDEGACGEGEDTGEGAGVDGEVAVEAALGDVVETRACGGEGAQAGGGQVGRNVVEQLDGERHDAALASLPSLHL